MKRFISLFLCIFLLLPLGLAGCNSSHTQDTDTNTDPTDNSTDRPTERPTEPATERPRDPNRLAKVNIVTGESDAEVFAGNELKKYLKKKDVECTDDGLVISVGIDEALGEDSYRILFDADSNEGLTITGGNGRGVLYGAYRFLEDQAGIRFFTPTLEVIPDDDIILGDISIEYTPVFKIRKFDWYPNRTSEDWMAKNGINDCSWFGVFSSSRGESQVHGNFVHSIGVLTGTGTAVSPNPCLTDPENLEKTIASVRQILRDKPTVTNISVSQNDNNAHCQCERCVAIDTEEGSPAGTMLRFVNAVASDIAEEYPNVVIDTLAYNYTQTPPLITKPLPNVAVQLCSIRCHFSHPLSSGKCDKNVTFLNDLSEWGKICDRIYIWDYTTNYRFSIPTFANFNVIRENMRIFANNNVVGMFPEGNYYSASGEFGELRSYLLAKLMQYPYMTEEEYNKHMCEFLEAYYGEGWSYILNYIRATSDEAANGCQNIYGSPFDGVREDYYRTMEDTFEEWWSKAEEMAGRRVAYVQRSRLQWRYIKLMLHPDRQEAKEFISDVERSGIYWGEGSLKDLPKGADLSKPPTEWFPFTWWLD